MGSRVILLPATPGRWRAIAVRSFLAAPLGVLLGLVAVAAPPPESQEARLAEQFVRALNAKDVESLVAATSPRFFYRNQKWETAKDGAGFVLGPVEDRIVSSRAGRRRLFAELVRTLKVEQSDATPVKIASYEKDRLKGISSRWSGLKLFEFISGIGDVYHIALVGVDPGNQKIAAFYIN